MTWSIDTKSKRALPAKLAAALVISAILALGILPANAADHGNDRRDEHHDWNGGYYQAPPVVYGSTYGSTYGPTYYGSPYYNGPTYAPPPVVYGPGIGISLPGISIGVQ